MQECNACRENITTPVCPHCLEQEVIAWLQDYFPNKPELRFNIMDITDDLVTGSYPISSNCLLCKGAVSVCRDCFVEEVINWLKKHYSSLIPNFLQVFASRMPVEEVVVQVLPIREIETIT